ncbi:tyrosine-protein phosphatase non-receptor type 20-like [Mytilus trossulus]|uniref:tyrosine-protein phosphatase non-receptor type 20-like n=1 Tax=Mytilus trossulus TaxID=6551 RepID=UPI003003CF99
MVPEFLKLLNEKDKYTRQVQLEFKNLSESDNPCHSGSEYYNETTSLMKHNNPASNTSYQNTALTIKERCTLLASAVPQPNSIDQFWEFVNKNGVEHIILLTKENQQVSEFYPGSHKPIEMNKFKLELDSSEKKNQNLFVFHLQLTNKKTKSSTSVKIYETTNWKEEDKHLPLEVLSQLLDVTRLSKSKSSLLMTNDELDICMAGILKVCADVFRAIDESTSFSVFQLAKQARSHHPRIFQEITDYELCYLLIQYHLESNHLYDAID